MPTLRTHEDYIRDVRDIAIARLDNPAERELLTTAKLVYGLGEIGHRGRTMYDVWDGGEKRDLIEVCAFGEQNPLQLAGTTLHELAHALAKSRGERGHGKKWKQACAELGLVLAEAGGQQYDSKHFDPEVLDALQGIDLPNDGTPQVYSAITSALPTAIGATLANPPKFRACSVGIGSRGGKSRGKGSGSRMRLYICEHGQKIRAATDALAATCRICGSSFNLV